MEALIRINNKMKIKLHIMTKLNFLLYFIFLTSFAIGQNQTQNNIYFQLGGNGLFLSMNYERPIIEKANIYGHVGVGMYGIQPTYLTIPFGFNYLLKLKRANNFIEFGIGATYTKAIVKLFAIVETEENTPTKVHYFNFIPSISYRWHTKGDFMYKIGATPIFNQYDAFPFFGFSIGKLF